MNRKSKADYEGNYRIGQRPARPLKPHNAVSWKKLEKLAASRGDGIMDFDEMSVLVSDHEHGTKTANYPYQFITYCIKRGWLVRA